MLDKGGIGSKAGICLESHGRKIACIEHEMFESVLRVKILSVELRLEENMLFECGTEGRDIFSVL